MKLILNNTDIEIKKTIDRITIFQWSHLAFLLIASILEYRHDIIGNWLFFKIIIISLFYQSFFKTLKNYYYTYWAFASLLVAYFGYKFLVYGFNSQTLSIGFFYLCALIILSYQSYLLFSPIYYPKLNWWEYDFRFIKDIKVNIRQSVNLNEARLSDIRRGRACLTSFTDYNLGEKLDLIFEDHIVAIKVQSKKETLFGRGIQYGVKFDKCDLIYNKLLEKWRRDISD